MEMVSEKSFRTILIMSVIFCIVLSCLLVLPMGGAEENETKLHGRVVDTNESPVAGATVTLLDVQTGATQTYTTSGSGKYEFFDVTGFFKVMAEADGYYDNGMGMSTDVLKVEKGEIVAEKLILVKVLTNVTYSGCVKDEFDDPVANATVAFYSTTNKKVSVVAETDMYGNYTAKLFWDNFKVLATADGYAYTTMDVIVNDNNLSYNMQLMEKTGVDWLIYGFAEDDLTLDSIDDINVHLYDVTNGWYVPMFGADTYIEDNYFQFKVYPSVYELVVDAKGYHTYVMDSIQIMNTINGKSRVLAVGMTADDPEVIDTTITFSDDMATITVEEDWTLTSASDFYGLSGIGSLRTQIDEEFGGAADGMIDLTEEGEFEDFLVSRGPYYLYTDGFIMVNGTYYEPKMVSGDIDFDVSITGVMGVVNSTGAIYVTSTMSYEAVGQVDALESLEVKFEAVRENQNINVVFPDKYEAIDNLPTDIAKVNPADVSQIEIFKPATVLIMDKEAPEALIRVSNAEDLTPHSTDQKTYVVDIREDITLTAEDSYDNVGSIVDYDWNLANGMVKTGEEITFNYTTGGSFNVTLTITDTSGMTDTDWVIFITDNEDPVPSFTIENETGALVISAEQNEIVTFNATNSTDNSEIESYTWTFSDNQETLTGKIVQHKFLDPGTFDITCEVTDVNGLMANITKTFTVEDTEAPLPVIVLNNETGGIAENLNIEAGEYIILNGNQSYDERIMKEDWDYDLSYAWKVVYKNSTETTILAKTTFTTEAKFDDRTDLFVLPGRYIVTLYVKDKSGNEANTTLDVTVVGPDFRVQSVILDPNENELREDEVTKVSVNITNSGTLDYEHNITVIIVFDGDEKDSQIMEGPWKAGDARTINLSFTPKNDGNDLLLEVIIDQNNDVKEEDETNNGDEVVCKVEKKEFRWQELLVIGIILVVVIAVIVAWKWRQGDLDEIIDKFRGGGFSPGKGKKDDDFEDDEDDDEDFDDEDED